MQKTYTEKEDVVTWRISMCIDKEYAVVFCAVEVFPVIPLATIILCIFFLALSIQCPPFNFFAYVVLVASKPPIVFFNVYF